MIRLVLTIIVAVSFGSRCNFNDPAASCIRMAIRMIQAAGQWFTWDVKHDTGTIVISIFMARMSAPHLSIPMAGAILTVRLSSQRSWISPDVFHRMKQTKDKFTSVTMAVAWFFTVTLPRVAILRPRSTVRIVAGMRPTAAIMDPIPAFWPTFRSTFSLPSRVTGSAALCSHFYFNSIKSIKKIDSVCLFYFFFVIDLVKLKRKTVRNAEGHGSTDGESDVAELCFPFKAFRFSCLGNRRANSSCSDVMLFHKCSTRLASPADWSSSNWYIWYKQAASHSDWDR